VGSRIAGQKDFPPAAVTNSAKIIRSFIEQYHEKLEEDYLFPRFRKHKLLVDLVDVLQAQHQAGRRVTEQILTLSQSGLKSMGANRSSQLRSANSFGCTHRTRRAKTQYCFRRCTRSFLATNTTRWGRSSKKKEHQMFGKEGFEGWCRAWRRSRSQLGIYELAQFHAQMTLARINKKTIAASASSAFAFVFAMGIVNLSPT